MSKFSNVAFQKNDSPSVGFNMVPQNNSFNSIFDLKPLDGEDAEKIELLLIENSTDSTSDNQIDSDTAILKQITGEIRAIGKQSVILMGERVGRASELLKPYRDGTFSKWLETAFGSRRTGYNIQSYYNLYKELPDDALRDKLKAMPQKSAYALASRKNADIETKAEIIQEWSHLDHERLMQMMKRLIPVDDDRSKKRSIDGSIATIRRAIQNLSSADALSKEIKEELSVLANELYFLGSDPS